MYILPALIKVNNQFLKNIAFIASPKDCRRSCPAAAVRERWFQGFFDNGKPRAWFLGVREPKIVRNQAVFHPKVWLLSFLIFPLPEHQN